MRMRTPLAEIERAFVDEMEEDRTRREQHLAQVQRRSRQRHLERQHKQGTFRFALLVFTLLGTAIVVTIAMFETLYYVMG
jgi:hypothetical protein